MAGAERRQRGGRPASSDSLEPDGECPLVGEAAGLGNQFAGGLWGPGVRHFAGGTGGKKSLLTLCFHRETGKELWRHDFGFGVDQRTHEKSNLAVNTPAVTEDAVYVAFGNADIARYSHDGKLIWVTRYMAMFGDPKMAWGYAVSPVVLDDSVLFPWDHHKGPCYLIGLDKRTGAIAWKKDRPIGTAHATPLLVSTTGRPTSSCRERTASPPSTPRRTPNCGSTAKARGRSTARSSSAPSTGTAWYSCNCGGRVRSMPFA